MYKDYFGFIEEPFSIVPSPRYLFLSTRHREALSHLEIGLNSGGGFVMLTGEVGTGKTTVSKAMIANLEDNWQAALLLNPTFSELELLEAICDEFGLSYSEPTSLKQLSRLIYQHLKSNHARGIKTLLLIDEAQHLSASVLEQLRLLTNLETDSCKLLKVLLVGQPELQHKLQTTELRQLAQRITGRYHLLPLNESEVAEYVAFRLRIAGVEQALFSARAVKVIVSQTQGFPRLINLICDKALHYAMLSQTKSVDHRIAAKACEDILAFQAPIGVSTPGGASATSYHRARSRTSSVRLAPAVLALLVAGITFTGLTGREVWDEAQHSQVRYEQQLAEQKQRSEVRRLEAETRQQRLNQLIASSRSQVSAMQALYGVWGYQASILDADCEYGTRPPLYCLSAKGTLAHLERLNRPVVLTLHEQGSTFFAVLNKINHDTIELLLGEQGVVLTKSWLETRWQGDYQALWYSDFPQSLRPNQVGEPVVKLDQVLAQVLDAPPLETNVYSNSLRQRVAAFQTWQGLTADGIAGQRTLRRLDSLSNVFAPRLTDSAPGEG